MNVFHPEIWRKNSIFENLEKKFLALEDLISDNVTRVSPLANSHDGIKVSLFRVTQAV